MLLSRMKNSWKFILQKRLQSYLYNRKGLLACLYCTYILYTDSKAWLNNNKTWFTYS